MIDHVSPLLRSCAAKIDNIPIRFVRSGEPDAEVRTVLADVLTVARYPLAMYQQVLESVLAADLSMIVVQKREMALVSVAVARELVMKAAERGLCPTYQADVFEVVASYARDQLLSADSSVGAGCLGAFRAEGGE